MNWIKKQWKKIVIFIGVCASAYTGGVYVNGNHLSTTEGLREFVSEIISKKAIGEKGYLIKRGLIPLQKQEYHDMISKINIT